MKKLVLMILSFAFSSESFANLDGVPLENQKNYLLAVTTGTEGEHTIGKWPYGRLADKTPTFYVSTKKCETEECFQSRDAVYNAVIAFARNYNDLMKQNGLDDKYHISVSDKERVWGGVVILLTDHLSSGTGRWDCSKGGDSGNFRGCKIKIRIGGYNYIHNLVAHEMLNVLGIQDTKQSLFDGCISSEYESASEDFCSIEKKAILFAYKHLRTGMKKGSIEKAFDRHWQGFDFTSVVNAN